MNTTNTMLLARIVREEKDSFGVILQNFNCTNDDHDVQEKTICTKTILRATVSGRLRHLYFNYGEGLWPAVGDYVYCQSNEKEQTLRIEEVGTRSSTLVRKAAGENTEQQVIAANLDSVFLVTSLNKEFNLRRIERTLVMIQDANIRPIIVLSKSDLMLEDEVAKKIAEIQSETYGAYAVHAINNKDENTLLPLKQYLAPGQTVALIGSSGVGKSTLINSLLERETQKVQDIGEFRHQGRHTTTSRHLFNLENGAAIIDTPGIREIQLWDSEDGEGISSVFADIEEIIQYCKFRNCSHQNDIGCNLTRAMNTGEIDRERVKSYFKLQREQDFMRRKADEVYGRESMRERRDEWKKITKQYRKLRKSQWSK